MSKPIFITGGTGYLGIRLIKLLLKKGHRVKALVRRGSEHKLPAGCLSVTADPFDASTFVHEVEKDSCFIQLLGVSHPGPSKKELFRKIDLASVHASVEAAVRAACQHFMYISVAQTPTNIMKDYQHCRLLGEQTIVAARLKTTILRPWYIIGPGHYWPLLFYPLFKLLEWLPATAQKAKALRLVFLNKMLQALVHAVENPPVQSPRIIEIEEIRRGYAVGTGS